MSPKRYGLSDTSALTTKYGRRILRHSVECRRMRRFYTVCRNAAVHGLVVITIGAAPRCAPKARIKRARRCIGNNSAAADTKKRRAGALSPARRRARFCALRRRARGAALGHPIDPPPDKARASPDAKSGWACSQAVKRQKLNSVRCELLFFSSGGSSIFRLTTPLVQFIHPVNSLYSFICLSVYCLSVRFIIDRFIGSLS